MTTIVHDADATLDPIRERPIAVVGYGNQGRPWALNLRDSGVDVTVCVRADETRERATADGFATTELDAASEFDVLCILIPDDVIPSLPIQPRADALVVVASGYTLAFDRFDPDGDVGHGRAAHARSGGAPLLRGGHRVHHRVRRPPRRDRHAPGAHARRRQGDRWPPPGRDRADRRRQEAVLDLAVEQALSPALSRVIAVVHAGDARARDPDRGDHHRARALGRGRAHVPADAGGRLRRAVRAPLPHEPVRPAVAPGPVRPLDVAATMRELVDDIDSGAFADEWDAERDAGYPELRRCARRPQDRRSRHSNGSCARNSARAPFPDRRRGREDA